MELLEQFKTYLLQGKDSPNKITVKNYLADVRKFIRWFEMRYARAFSPRLVTNEIVEDFKSQLTSRDSQTQIASASSLKRYLSSLRKFYQFLKEKNIADHNPFDGSAQEAAQPADRWHVKAFKNYLFLSHASKPTIKNYLMDVRQFITWFETVAPLSTASQAISGTSLNIDNKVIEEYKNRLVYDARFEPRSVNRKLSSLRKYFAWANNEGIFSSQPEFSRLSIQQTQQTAPSEPAVELSQLQQITNQPQTNQEKPVDYSTFPPLRLLQKIGRGSSWIFDLLIISPVASSVLAVKYQLWKLKGREVFTPVEAFVGVSAKAPAVSTGRNTPSVTMTAVPVSAFDTFITGQTKPVFAGIGNLPKSVYAPLSISTADFTIHKKIIHHVRHTRPKWYKKYHSYRIVHYLHFGVALIYASVLGFMVYQAITESPRFSAPVLASLPASPPRMLAFEGTLADATNTPITAEQTLRFGLYNSPTASGSALLWQETQVIQPDNNGNFKALLGKNSPIRQNMLTDNPTLFLGIAIGAQEELAPRQQIATVAYSQDSEKLQGMDVITQPDADTKNVILALDSAGDLIIGGSASPRFEATGGEFTLAGRTLILATSEGSNGNVQIVPDGSGIVDIQKPIQNTTNYSSAPGIEGAVEIADSMAVFATSSAQSAFYINQNGTGDLISASSSGTAKFTVTYLGRGTFASDLAVNGINLTTDSNTFNLLNRNVINLNIGGQASNISIGSSSGQTTISNKLVANNGLTLPNGKDLILEGFSKGAIPFPGSNKQLTQDSDNFVWAQDSKRLGLGTNTPLYRLDVRDEKSTESISQIYNTSTGSDADGLIVKLGNNAGSVSTNNEFIRFETAGAGLVGSIRGNGGNGIQIVNGSFADWAEYMPKDPSEEIPYGSLLCLQDDGNVTACTRASGTVIGVASENPTIIAGKDLGEATVPVGLIGIVKTRITSLNGTVKPGDMIATSSQKGRGAKAIYPGTIVGRALEAYDNPDPTATGTILVAVQVGWYDPQLTVNQQGDVLDQQYAQLQDDPTIMDGIIENIKLGMNEVENLTVQSLSVATENITIGSLTLREYVTAIAQETTRELENQFFTRKLVSPIAEIAQVKTNIISPLAEDANIALQFDTSRIEIVNPEASNSAVASIDNEGNARFAGDLEADDASFSGTLRAQRIIADQIEGLNIQAATVAANYITNVTNVYNIASGSAEPTPSSLSSNPSLSSAPSTEDTPLLESTELAKNLEENPTFETDFPTFIQGILALGGSSFTDVGITGTLRIGDNMLIEEASINTIGTELALQPLRQGAISLMAGLVTIDTQGNAVFNKDVTVHGTLSAHLLSPVPDSDLILRLGNMNQESGIKNQGKNHDSSFIIHDSDSNEKLRINKDGDIIASGAAKFQDVAAREFTIIRGAQADTSLTTTIAEGSGGTAVITANERERTIISPYIKPTSLIYVTPASQTYGVTPYIARQTAKSFTIQIPYTVTRDIKLNWWIVN